MSPLIRLALAINLISSSYTFRIFMKYLTLLHTLLKWTLYFIFHRLYYPLFRTLFGEELGTCHHVPTYVSREDVEDCAVCLRKMGERDEIITLRCEHVFHSDCLDTWIGFNNATCPLCRESVGPKRGIGQLVSAQVLLFESSSINTDDCEINWLR
ncbi:putative RING-H2 finger protein ATL50 [Spatholobus suberectus]|nr:putative RING-H2 finger protein ATL50 [Spatholobus suberectus]